MAGMPGRSGGPRPNSGGKRPGAGRPKKQAKPIEELAQGHSDPREFLLSVMNDPAADAKLRVDAAKALMPFTHQKLGEGGKKDARQEAARKASGGRFAAAAPPKLVVNNRG